MDSILKKNISQKVNLLKENMMKKLIFLLMILGFITPKLKAEWIPVSKNKTAATKTSPRVKILSDNENCTVIDIDIFGFDLNEFYSKGKTYHSVDLLTEMFSAKSGYPELPYISKILAIPDNASVSVEVLKTGDIQIFKDIHLKPAQESWFEGMPESDYEENASVYQSDDIYPNNFVNRETPSVFRDFRISRLSIFPIRYIPSKNELQVVSSVTIRINYVKVKQLILRPQPKKQLLRLSENCTEVLFSITGKF